MAARTHARATCVYVCTCVAIPCIIIVVIIITITHRSSLSLGPLLYILRISVLVMFPIVIMTHLSSSRALYPSGLLLILHTYLVRSTYSRVGFPTMIVIAHRSLSSRALPLGPPYLHVILSVFFRIVFPIIAIIISSAPLGSSLIRHTPYT